MKKTLWILFGLFTLTIISGCGMKVNNQTQNEGVNNPIQNQTIPAVFDLEKLYGKNIDEIRTVLGKPTNKFFEPTKQQINLGMAEGGWDNTFEKDGYELLITYDVSSRNVIDFFIGTDDPSGKTQDTTNLKQLLNVQYSTNFIVEPVKALGALGFYTGIKAIPKK